MLNEIFNVLAMKHSLVKFVKCVATKIVENYKDKDAPGLILY